MKNHTLHITSGDCAGGLIADSEIHGEVFVWHDILYQGPRKPGWPDEATLLARSDMIVDATGGGLSQDVVLKGFHEQYRKLAGAGDYGQMVLWFDACLFDLSMLAHILACMTQRGICNAELLYVDAFPGIEPYNGLGQLTSEQLASVFGQRKPVDAALFSYAQKVDAAFSAQDPQQMEALAAEKDTPIPGVPAAARRWLQEQPDAETGLGRLATHALEVIRSGKETPRDIFIAVAALDIPPQYWGDITLWAEINALADRSPPQVKIEGPATRLPQWESNLDLKAFRITPL